MKNEKRSIGMIGLGVMGRNLVLNLEDNGFPVAVWNLEPQWTKDFISREGSDRRITAASKLEELSNILAPPRLIFMMIKAGRPVDKIVRKLVSCLDTGDVLVDGGNSHFNETETRQKYCRNKGFHFFGMGVSGGEEGARNGPSLMPGGNRSVYKEQLGKVLKKIAAKSDDGPCVTYIGPAGAGHFVKMVHNGIEYGDMELIAEAYDVMKKGLGMDSGEIGEVFSRCNQGRLSSYLMEISAQIMKVEDPITGNPLVEMILDKAGQKGTGKWTAQSALDLGVPVPTISAALDARFLSAIKDQRVQAADCFPSRSQVLIAGKREVLEKLEKALYASKLCAYAQGMAVIAAGSQEYKWGIDKAEVCRIWKGGCIIRSKLLDVVQDVFEDCSDIKNLLLDRKISALILGLENDWRTLVTSAESVTIPTLSMSASLRYFDAFRTENLPLNLTQAQRDFFGAHTYCRVDDPERKDVHTDWKRSKEKG